MGLIQLQTVSLATDPSDYWPEWFYRTDEHTAHGVRCETAYLVTTGYDIDIGHIYRMCDYDTIIVEEAKEYHYPDTDNIILVYDGHGY